MLTKQNLAEMMVKNPERTGCYFSRIGERVVLTFPPKSLLMPADVPTISDPECENFRLAQVAEEIAERAITHSLCGNWQKKVAKEFGIDPKRIIYQGYKVVAVKDGKYLSLYDGKTEYKIGELLEQTAKRGHQGGYYVTESLIDCVEGDIPLPANAVLQRWLHRAILCVEFGGKTIKYKDKVVASWVRPLYVVKTFSW